MELCEELATRGVVAVEEEGVVLLGAPMGSQEFMEEVVEKNHQLDFRTVCFQKMLVV